MSSALEEPMLSRLTRLNNILKQLEEMRDENHSPKSSYASTTSSGALTSTSSLADVSTKGLHNKNCRSVEEMILEVERKGTLIDRLVHAEDRILKMEEEFEAQTRKDEKRAITSKKGLKQYLKSWVPRKKHKN